MFQFRSSQISFLHYTINKKINQDSQDYQLFVTLDEYNGITSYRDDDKAFKGASITARKGRTKNYSLSKPDRLILVKRKGKTALWRVTGKKLYLTFRAQFGRGDSPLSAFFCGMQLWGHRFQDG